MSDLLEPPERCQYCHNLKPGHIEQTPFNEWATGICGSSCHTCRVVVQGIMELYPGFLKGESGGPAPGTHAGEDVRLSVYERCRVCVSISTNGMWHRGVDVQFYYSVADPARLLEKIPQIGYGADIALVPGDKQMWSFLRRCLADCVKYHEECKVSQDLTWYPERLLHLTQNKACEDVLQLVQTSHHIPTSRYIALSHCWGSNSPLCTIKNNLSQFLDDISISELPMTFRGCLTTARELEVHYIWIDSLCIIQDDRQDWARHARSMDKIYENALFTVAAVCSPNGQVPFLGPHAPSNRETWQAIDINIDSEGVDSPEKAKGASQAKLKARRCDVRLLPYFFHGPLELRGWAWQERYLSVRIINFTEEEARWHCKVFKTCECRGTVQRLGGEIQLHSKYEADDLNGLSTIQQWRCISKAYSKRGLTYSTDRLPALSGAASRFSISIQSEYLAGMWLSDFPRTLAWYRRELSDCRTGKPKMWRSLDNGVPSWSWASVFGEIYWMWEFDFESAVFEDIPIESRVELVDYKCKESTDNVFGEVEKSSYIELKGMVVEAEMESDIHGSACVRRSGFGPQHVVPDCHVISAREFSFFQGSRKITRRAIPTDFLAESLTDGQHSTGQVSCLLLFTTSRNGRSHACVLILGKQLDGTYQRLGIGNSDSGCSRPLYKERKSWEVWENWAELEEWESWEAWFSDAETQTMKIK